MSGRNGNVVFLRERSDHVKKDRDTFPYEDILHLPRPVSTRRAKMSTLDRAAQFSPFSALNGYDDAITETARLTEGRVELTEGEKARINTRLQAVVENKAYDETFIIRYFKYDLRKAGGAYLAATGSIKKVDPYARSVIMDDGICIPIEHICSIDGEMFNDAENDFGNW